MDFGNTLLMAKDGGEQNAYNGMGQFNIIQAATEPEKVIQAYKGEAMKMGIKLVLIQAAAFVFLSYLVFRNTKVRT